MRDENKMEETFAPGMPTQQATRQVAEGRVTPSARVFIAGAIAVLGTLTVFLPIEPFLSVLPSDMVIQSDSYAMAPRLLGAVACVVLIIAIWLGAGSHKRAGIATGVAVLGAFAYGISDALYTISDSVFSIAAAVTAVSFSAGAAAWLIARKRRGLAYLSLIFAFVGTFAVPFSGMYWTLDGGIAGYVVTALLIATSWLAALIDHLVARPRPTSSPAGILHPLSVGQVGTNALAIASFISVWFVSVAGIVMGHVALSQIKRTGQQGRGLALAAVIVGWISLGVAIAIIITLVITVGARPTSRGFAQD